MNGILEKGIGTASEVVATFRQQPLQLAMFLMNIALLLFLFYYLSRITSRTEVTVAALFQSQDKLYEKWTDIIKDTNALVEKTSHCILPADAILLMQARPDGTLELKPAPPEPEAKP